MAGQKQYPVSGIEASIGLPGAAVLSGMFLSGAMASLSAFVIPVLVGTNSDAHHTTRQWALLYQYGRQYMPMMAVGTCGLYAAAALRPSRKSKHVRYPVAIAVTMAMVPFTWLFMAPTNDILFGLEAAGNLGTIIEKKVVRELLIRWAWLHIGRTMFPLLGVLVGVTGLSQDCGHA